MSSYKSYILNLNSLQCLGSLQYLVTSNVKSGLEKNIEKYFNALQLLLFLKTMFSTIVIFKDQVFNKVNFQNYTLYTYTSFVCGDNNKLIHY